MGKKGIAVLEILGILWLAGVGLNLIYKVAVPGHVQDSIECGQASKRLSQCGGDKAKVLRGSDFKAEGEAWDTRYRKVSYPGLFLSDGAMVVNRFDKFL